jgi:hypothetical protein
MPPDHASQRSSAAVDQFSLGYGVTQETPVLSQARGVAGQNGVAE